MKKPKIGIPIGDPAGIGPEIALKACLHEDVLSSSIPILIGDVSVLKHMIDICQLPLQIHLIKEPDETKEMKGFVNVIDVKSVDIDQLQFGTVHPMNGKAAFDYIKKTVEFAMNRKIDAMATTPINKESLKAANVPYIGHTEILADLSHTKDPLTMFQVEKERVFFLSRHVSLKKAIELVKKDRLMDYIKRSLEALEKLGVKGTLAVAGLNPHNGEHGMFGSEELDEIMPAIEEMKQKGFDVTGPIPADSIFALGLSGKWAAILSLYHDQGHIATKTYDFHKTISITSGMPFLRTSVDHGTALDIAGQNKANPLSMVEAIRLAAEYAPYFITAI